MDQTNTAASSPAELADPFNGEQPTMAEYSTYRASGELPERFKPAEEATTDAPEETAVETADDESETASESDPEEEAQEPPQKGSGAEKRIKQLLAEKKELQRKLEATAKQDEKTEPSTAQEAQQPNPQQYTRPKPTLEDSKPDGTPKYSSYEDFMEELSYWVADQREAKTKREREEQDARRSLQVKLDEARSRYDDADDVIFPSAKAIQDAKIPLAVKEVFAQSDHFPYLCYVVGSDPDELKKFISLASTNPRAALAKVFDYERGIREELAKTGKEVDEPESGKAPVKKTSAPKPPSPVSGGGKRVLDVSDESLSADEWARKRNEELRRKGKA